ncbi:uncharacterized protein TNCV_1385931 [Trichonephila clavipes]|nr:uncharacterized protein TNCV_1385931 [Trichonephila clavipes]
MDPIDAFPEHLSTTVVPVTLPDKPDALEYAARQGQVRAGIIYQEPTAKRVFVLFCKDHWHQKKTWLDNFKRAVMEAKHVNEFRPNDVMWEKTSKGLLRNPDRLLKNTDTRMVYIYNNIFFAKKDFTFGLRTVKSGEIHLIQTTHVPMLIYELPASSLKCRAHPNVIRRSFEPHDQMLYHRTILEPHTAYPIPAGTHYIVLTVQKSAFGLDIIPESLLPQLIQKGFHVGDFRKMKKFNQTPYKLPPPTPIHVPAEKRPLEEKALPKKRVRITPTCADSRCPTITCADSDVLEPVPIPDVPPSPVHIPQPPVHIPQPPVQIPDVLEPPVQIPVSHVPEPPVQIPLVQIPDVPEHVQIPMSQVPQPPMQILPEPMNILHVSEPVQIPDDPEPVQIQCHKSHSHLCRFSQNLCRLYMYQNLCRFQCHTSHSHLCRFYMHQNLCKFQCHTSHSHLCRFYMNLCRFQCHTSHSHSTVTCAESHPPVQSPRTYAASPRARHVGPFGVDRCIRPAHVVCIWTPRTPAASHGTLYF